MQEESRKVKKMFGEIAGHYDLMNRLMTFGQDQVWRRCAVAAADLPRGGILLDAGTGTGRIGREVLKTDSLVKVVGSDFSYQMMEVGKKTSDSCRMMWCAGDALQLPFKNNSFDAVTSGYLIRNVTDVVQAFSEQVRVVKPGGRVVCLDTSPPPDNRLRPVILLFLNKVIPLLGQVISKNRSAYTYLPESTKGFLPPEKLAGMMRASGLRNIRYRGFMFRTIGVHVGTKP